MDDQNPNPTRLQTHPEDDPIPPDPLLDPGTFIHVDPNDDVTPAPVPPESDSDFIDLSEVIDGQTLNDANLTDTIDGQNSKEVIDGRNSTEVVDVESLTPDANGANLTNVIGGQNSTGESNGQNLTDGTGGQNLTDVIDGGGLTETKVVDGESLSMSEKTPSSQKKGSKRLPVELAGRPDWLPEDWRYEIRMRVSGATAGSYDRYYFSPTGRNFRSKAEVLRFLETGSRKKKRGADDETPTASSEKPKAKRPKRKKGDFSSVDFDFENPPKNVSWTLTNASHDIWTAVADEVITPESTQRKWEDAFSCITGLEKK